MAGKSILLDRDTFREAVFARDNHACVFCKKTAAETPEGKLDAHHIIERRLFTAPGEEGGYFTDNGASVCESHHLECEMTTISVEEVREAASITKAVIPAFFYEDQIYTKWGDIVLPNGTRSKGPLFHDESVQKVLARAGLLDRYVKYVKHPRLPHLPWSPGVNDDDRIIESLEGLIGKEVVLTEKMDGCFIGRTKITMADGTRIKIKDIVKGNLKGEYVLGMDASGNIVPSKILNVFEHGSAPAHEWMKIKVSGRNNLTYCTKNHQWWIPGRGYVRADQLKSGDKVLHLRDGLPLTPMQEQVILGKLLGDASLHLTRSSRNWHESGPNGSARIAFSHKDEHLSYVEWTNRALGELARSITLTTSGYGSTIHKGASATTRGIYETFSCMLRNGEKFVPESIAARLTPISLAFWYMDDGNLTHTKDQQDRVTISTCGFDQVSIGNLINSLLRLGIDARIKKYRGYNYIIINSDQSERLFLLIAPYIPPVMQYKLPERYRGGEGWLPNNSNSQYMPWVQEMTIEGVENHAHALERLKFDIETETHNFFANGFLVHNSNTSIYNDYLHTRAIDGRSHESMNWIKTHASRWQYQLADDERVCGENLYAQHSIVYGEDNPLASYFMGFSLWKGDLCLGWDDTLEYFEILGVTPVPVVWRGIWDEKQIRNLYDPTKRDLCEGYVVRLASSFRYGEFKRSVAKFVREGHVQTAKHHWRSQRVIPNSVIGDSRP